jgi:hypothetical protein
LNQADLPVPGFPYFPAEVVDAEVDADEISPAVFAERVKAMAVAKGAKLYLVNFYDKLDTYGWIQEKFLDLLGEDDGQSSFMVLGQASADIVQPSTKCIWD